MKTKIELINQKGFGWYTAEYAGMCCHAKGKAFRDMTLLGAEDVARCFAGNKENTLDSICSAAQQIDGAFSVVGENEDCLFAVVDKTRYFPLFYLIRDDVLYVSDSASHLRGYAANGALDADMVFAYRHLSYVTGENTLVQEIKQLRAGEMLFLDKKSGQIEKKKHYEYGYWRNSAIADASVEEKLRRLDEIHLKVFKRAVDMLNGRTVLLSLSAGQDSRLVAVMLKRLGYQNVITYTYGRENNVEVADAKAVAEALGYPWYFVTYTGEDWKTGFESGTMDAFLHYASELNALGHLGNFYALQYLKQQGIVDTNCVCLFGSIYDCLCGSRYPKSFISKNRISKEYWLQRSLRDYASLSKSSMAEQKRLKKMLWPEIKEDMSHDVALNAFYKWYYPERGSKFFLNTIRSYEFFGFEWINPLHDKELCEFWFSVDRKDYINRRLYFLYAGEYIAPHVGIKDAVPSATIPLKKRILHNYYVNEIGTAVRGLTKVDPIKIKTKEPLAYFDWYTDAQLQQLGQKYGHAMNGNSVNLDYYLSMVENAEGE